MAGLTILLVNFVCSTLMFITNQSYGVLIYIIEIGIEKYT